MAQRVTVFHDSLTRFVLPLCTAMRDRQKPTTPISNAVYVVDASAVSVKQGWDLKDFAQEISSILITCYPETIERILVSRSMPASRDSSNSISARSVTFRHISQPYGVFLRSGLIR
jgi:hypothetical protein